MKSGEAGRLETDRCFSSVRTGLFRGFTQIPPCGQRNPTSRSICTEKEETLLTDHSWRGAETPRLTRPLTRPWKWEVNDDMPLGKG